MQNKYEIIELCDFVYDKVIELISESYYKENAKKKTKVITGAIINFSLELKHHLLLDGDMEDKDALQAFNLMNELYCKIYGVNDKPKLTIYNKIKNERNNN